MRGGSCDAISVTRNGKLPRIHSTSEQCRLTFRRLDSLREQKILVIPAFNLLDIALSSEFGSYFRD